MGCHTYYLIYFISEDRQDIRIHGFRAVCSTTRGCEHFYEDFSLITRHHASHDNDDMDAVPLTLYSGLYTPCSVMRLTQDHFDEAIVLLAGLPFA